MRFDASEDSIELAPQSGTASPIVRIGRRDPEGGESLSYAIRLRGLTAGTTARLQPTPDGRGVQLSADVAARQVDVEVTHNARNGRQRLLERGAVGIPAGAQARFSITEPTELEDPGALPLLVDLVADGATSRLEFGDGPIGPARRGAVPRAGGGADRRRRGWPGRARRSHRCLALDRGRAPASDTGRTLTPGRGSLGRGPAAGNPPGADRRRRQYGRALVCSDRVRDSSAGGRSSHTGEHSVGTGHHCAAWKYRLGRARNLFRRATGRRSPHRFLHPRPPFWCRR